MNNTYEELLTSVKNMTKFEDFEDENYISLYDVYTTLKRFNIDTQITSLSEGYSKSFEQTMTENYKECKVKIDTFDYDTKVLKILFDIDYNNYTEYKPICFIKEDSELFVYSDETYKQVQIMKYLYDDISYIYDELSSLATKKNENCYDIGTISTKFNANISYNIVEITYNNDKNISFVASITDDISINCDSSNFKKELNNYKEELFRHLLVSIDDCPSWLHSVLHDIRRKQLSGIISLGENNKQKKLSLFNRFNFLRK